jgi:uncharacterized protein (TIGR03086 family)
MTTDATTGWTVLDTAHDALRTVVAGVADAAWDSPTPCSSWSVTQVLQHAAGDQEGYAASLGFGSGPEADPFAPSGVLASTPLLLLEPALAVTAAAYRTVGAEATAVSVPVPPGALPAATAAGACALDATVHAWDIAVATGQPSPLDDALAADLVPVARVIVEPLRGFAFAAALTPEPGESPTEELLRYLGRDPRWTP